MSVVVRLQSPKTIDGLVKEIRLHLYDAKGAKAKLEKHRLVAGQKLLELRSRIEAGEAGEGVSWWEWFETADIGRGRKDAEKLMRLAKADDPEAAYEEDKKRVREAVKQGRDGVYVNSKDAEYDIVSHAMNLVAKMSEEERAEFNTRYTEKYDV